MKAFRAVLRGLSSGAKQVTNDTNDTVPRAFSSKTKEGCWNNAPLIPGRDGARWRLDANGFPVLKVLNGKMGCCGYEFDHILPHAAKGPNTPDNIQLIQSSANRAKSDKVLDSDGLKNLGYNMELNDFDLDKLEFTVHGDVVINGKTFPFLPTGKFGNNGVGQLSSILRTLATYRASLLGDSAVKGAAADEDESPCLPLRRPLSGLFYHTASSKEPGYLAFDAIHCTRQLILDPRFSAFPEPVSVLASTGGLVCVIGETTGYYYVANPATFSLVRLPRPTQYHLEPAVVMTFEKPSPNTSAGSIQHYNIIVAFLSDGMWAFESFSSRTWEWTFSPAMCSSDIKATSGVGTLGHAFWRTSIGSIICFDPKTGYLQEFLPPPAVSSMPFWEIGEMEDKLCVTCMDQHVTSVAVFNLDMDLPITDCVVLWSLAGRFEGGRLRNREGVELLRSQGMAEVVMLDTMEEHVVTMDLEGRTTLSFGPLTDYSTAGFVPYVPSSALVRSTGIGGKL